VSESRAAGVAERADVSAGRRSRLLLIAPALPPQLDGIGDYSALVARELAREHDVRVVTVRGERHDPVPGVEVVSTFAPTDHRSCAGIYDRIAEYRPDWVVLQYNPFSYGNRGYNPTLPGVMERTRRELPGIGIAMMAHETFVPWTRPQWWVMNTWQYPQFYRLGKVSDVLFLSTEAWVGKFARWFPGKRVVHLPVGANIPREAITRDEAKARLGLSPETRVLGLFGTAHISRQFDWVAEAYRQARREFPDSLLLYVGPHGADILGHTGDMPVRAEGPFPPDEVSRRLSAMDLMCAPYLDGVSTRRGAFMAGIQHGIPTVSTDGPSTDATLRGGNGTGLLLSPTGRYEPFAENVACLLRDADLRARISRGAESLYWEKFDWPVICRAMLENMPDARSRRGNA
jgi:glycosyltransferase involved in cell wall biosynthesis